MSDSTTSPRRLLVAVKQDEISVLQRNGRLEIVADIDAAGIARLQKMLMLYVDILDAAEPTDGK